MKSNVCDKSFQMLKIMLIYSYIQFIIFKFFKLNKQIITTKKI